MEIKSPISYSKWVSEYGTFNRTAFLALGPLWDRSFCLHLLVGPLNRSFFIFEPCIGKIGNNKSGFLFQIGFIMGPLFGPLFYFLGPRWDITFCLESFWDIGT